MNKQTYFEPNKPVTWTTRKRQPNVLLTDYKLAKQRRKTNFKQVLINDWLDAAQVEDLVKNVATADELKDFVNSCDIKLLQNYAAGVMSRCEDKKEIVGIYYADNHFMAFYINRGNEPIHVRGVFIHSKVY